MTPEQRSGQRPIRIYIAGPYTAGDVAVNVRHAIEAGDRVARWGAVPFIPHLSHFWHLLFPQPWEFWLTQDLQWLALCDAVLRLPGESHGADLEEAEAGRLGIPVFYDFPAAYNWYLETCRPRTAGGASV